MTTNENLAAVETIGAAYRAVGDARENDPEFRALLEEDPRAALASKGMEVPEGVEVRVHANDADTLYIAFPPDPNQLLSDISLDNVSGGVPASSAGCAGSASSLSTFPSCAGSVATASTLGSAACSS